MTLGNIVELNVNEKAQGYAKVYAALIKDDYQRKRAYASLVALYALVEALEKTDNDLQKSMTIFRNPVLNEQYEISDLYINNWHIDVRVITDGDAFLVPKSHYDNGITPDFYAVVKVDKALEKAELLGFADVQKVEKEAVDYHYCSILLSSLISYDEFLSKVNAPKNVEFAPEEHEMFKELYLSLLDEEMKPEVKNKILKHLFKCPQCRTEFCCFTGFEMVSCNMGRYPSLFDDMTLSIIGAQDVDNEKYVGKEQTIYIGTDEQAPVEEEPIVEEMVEANATSEELIEPTIESTIEPVVSVDELTEPIPDILDVSASEAEAVSGEVKEMTVSDILDELFGIEEGFIEPEVPQEKTQEQKIDLNQDDFDFDETAMEESIDAQLRDEETKPAFVEDEPLDSYVEIPVNFDNETETEPESELTRDVVEENVIETVSPSNDVLENEIKDDFSFDGIVDENDKVELEKDIEPVIDDIAQDVLVEDVIDDVVPAQAEDVQFADFDEVVDESVESDGDIENIPEQFEVFEDEIESESITEQEETVAITENEIELETDDEFENEIKLEPDDEKIVDLSDDMQVIEEDSVESYIQETEEFSIDSEIDEEMELLETEQDMEVIEETVEDEIQSLGEDIYSIDEPQVLYSDMEEEPELDVEVQIEEELEILNESETVIENATADAQESVQQVIVDYDDFGEPVYSYITNVSQEAQFITDDVMEEYEDDDILNQDFMSYSPDEDNAYENNQQEESSDFEKWGDSDDSTDEMSDDYEQISTENEEVKNIDSDFEEYNDDYEEEKEEDSFSSGLDDFELEDDDVESENENSKPVPVAPFSKQIDEDIEEMEVDSFEENFENSDEESSVSDQEVDDEELDDEEYEEYEEDDDEEEEEELSNKKKSSPLIALFLLLLLVVGGAGGAFFFLKNKNQEVSTPIAPEAPVNNVESPLVATGSEAGQVEDMFGSTQDDAGLEISSKAVETKNDASVLPAPPAQKTESKESVPVKPLTEKDLLKKQVSKNTQASKSIAKVFSNGGNRAVLRSVNWKCAPQLFADSVFKAYMQDLDGILKLNLRKNILDVTETPKNNSVVTKMAINKDGNLSKIVVSTSSGSEQIDNIVLQSIKETFEGEKAYNLKNSALKQDMYYLKLVIEL